MVHATSMENESFKHLVKRFYLPVVRFFANRGFSQTEAEDLTQETFLNVYRGLSGFRSEASEATWLFKIAANTWRNALRFRSSRFSEESSLGDLSERTWEPTPWDAKEIDPLQDVLDRERKHLVREAIEELPPQMRRCVFLRVAQDMKYREIAQVMQISIQTVRSQLHDARELLRRKLGDALGDTD